MRKTKDLSEFEEWLTVGAVSRELPFLKRLNWLVSQKMRYLGCSRWKDNLPCLSKRRKCGPKTTCEEWDYCPLRRLSWTQRTSSVQRLIDAFNHGCSWPISRRTMNWELQMISMGSRMPIEKLLIPQGFLSKGKRFKEHDRDFYHLPWTWQNLDLNPIENM